MQVIPLVLLFYHHLQQDLSWMVDESHENYNTQLLLSQDSGEGGAGMVGFQAVELEWEDSPEQRCQLNNKF